MFMNNKEKGRGGAAENHTRGYFHPEASEAGDRVDEELESLEGVTVARPARAPAHTEQPTRVPHQPVNPKEW